MSSFSYDISGQLAEAVTPEKSESFYWDGLALIQRDSTCYVNEPSITGGNPILADGRVLFNDMLGTTLGIKDGDKVTQNNLSAFGESLSASTMEDSFFTGKPHVGEMGYAFLFRSYRADQGKWQTADPLGYPDGWNNFAYVNNGVTTAIDWMGGSCVLWRSWENVPGSLHEEETFVKVLVSHNFVCGGAKEQSLSYSENTSFSISFQIQYQGTGIPVSYNISFNKSETFKVYNMYPTGHDAGIEHDVRGSYTYSLELYVVTRTVLCKCKDCGDVEAVVTDTFFRTKDKISKEIKCVYE